MIFNGVSYHLSSSLPPSRAQELDVVLINNGATPADSLATATHVVTNSNQFEGWQNVAENTLVVTVSLPLRERLSFLILYDVLRRSGSRGP